MRDWRRAYRASLALDLGYGSRPMPKFSCSALHLISERVNYDIEEMNDVLYLFPESNDGV